MNIDQNLKNGDNYDEAVNKQRDHKLSRLSNDDRVTLFGETHFRGENKKFGIKAKDRTRHTYVIGKTGMGKSTLLENLAIQDIQNGEGLCFIDPHGSSAEKLLSYVPEWRMKDVVYFNPSDMKYPIGLNVLEFAGEDVRHLVSSGLMNTFKKIFEDQFSGRMVYLLQNAILSILENEDESLLGINRIFTDKQYRNKILNNVKDPAVKSYWEDEFAKYTDKYIQEAAPAIQNKIGQFISNPLIRNIIGQKHTSFDIRKIMDERKILICNLSLGLTGEDNVDLIGSLLVTKIYLAALSRANLSHQDLIKAPPFYLYVDEFQNFVNESFAQILSQARKYNLGLIVAHQYIDQLDDATRSAIFGNVGTMISFRVGASDAEVLEKEFQPTFLAEDVVNLARYEMLVRLSIDGVSSSPFSALSMSPVAREGRDLTQAVIALSRAVYGKSKDYVEEEILEWYNGNKNSNQNNNSNTNSNNNYSNKTNITSVNNKNIHSNNSNYVNNTIKNTINNQNLNNDNLNLKSENNPIPIVNHNLNKNLDLNNTKNIKSNQNEIDKQDANKKDLQKIREKELEKTRTEQDLVYGSLFNKNLDKNKVNNENQTPLNNVDNFNNNQNNNINHNNQKNNNTDKESVSQIMFKASNVTGFVSNSNIDNNKNKDSKSLSKSLGNFALRDALNKAMQINPVNNSDNINNSDKKVSDLKNADKKDNIPDNKIKDIEMNDNLKDNDLKDDKLSNKTLNISKKSEQDHKKNNDIEKNKNKDFQDNNSQSKQHNNSQNTDIEDIDIQYLQKILKGENQ